MDQTEESPISFFDHIEDVKTVVKNKSPLIFLDYDGTLTPIVDTPDLAIITDDMKDAVQRLSDQFKVSVVSGRATDDVRSKLNIDGIFYAGSHGFEIIQPDGNVEVVEEAQKISSVIDEAHAKLSGLVKNIQGALVEHVKYTISMHYRLVSDDDFPKIESAVDKVLKEYPDLHKTSGKKVFEIRPKIDWDKGKAVERILSILNFNPEKDIPVYIGDDSTDEDAFRVVRTNGFGVLVAKESRSTEAQYIIKNTSEVKQVLEIFIDLFGG